MSDYTIVEKYQQTKGCYNLNEMTTIIEASKIVLLSGENTIS